MCHFTQILSKHYNLCNYPTNGLRAFLGPEWYGYPLLGLWITMIRQFLFHYFKVWRTALFVRFVTRTYCALMLSVTISAFFRFGLGHGMMRIRLSFTPLYYYNYSISCIVFVHHGQWYWYWPSKSTTSLTVITNQ